MNFNVPKWIYKEVEEKKKLVEYREFKPYWEKRLSKLVVPFDAFIVCGYSKNKISITVFDIRVIEKCEIFERKYRDFIKTQFCYRIEYYINPNQTGDTLKIKKKCRYLMKSKNGYACRYYETGNWNCKDCIAYVKK